MRSTRPDDGSQILAVSSRLPDASSDPSALYAIDETPRVCPASTCSTLRVSRFQIVMLSFHEPTARCLSSGDHASCESSPGLSNDQRTRPVRASQTVTFPQNVPAARREPLWVNAAERQPALHG